jgi:hypothetical protein
LVETDRDGLVLNDVGCLAVDIRFRGTRTDPTESLRHHGVAMLNILLSSRQVLSVGGVRTTPWARQLNILVGWIEDIAFNDVVPNQ